MGKPILPFGDNDTQLVVDLARLLQPRLPELVADLQAVDPWPSWSVEVLSSGRLVGIAKDLLKLFVEHLARGDLEGYFDAISSASSDYASRGFVYEDLVRCNHFCRQFSLQFPFRERPSLGALEDLLLALDILYENSLALIASSYFEMKEETIEEKVSELTALQSVTDTAISALDLDDLLHGLLERLVEVMEVNAGAILLLKEETQELTVVARATQGLPEEPLTHFTEKVGAGLSGRVALERRPLTIQDADNDASITSPYIKRHKIKSMLGVPLEVKGRLIGVAHVDTLTPHQFTVREIKLLQILAERAATAIENGRLHERIRQLAVTEERNRLAREIHDTLAQGLSGIVLQLEAVDRLLLKEVSKARTELEEAKILARHTLQEARRSVWNLRPAPLERISLSQAIARETDNLAKDIAAQTRFTVVGRAWPLAPDLEVTLYRIVQEALANVRRHAQAGRVEVSLDFGPPDLVLTIGDDGSGFDPDIAKNAFDERRSFGLLGMQERARIAGGTLVVESTLGRGTRVQFKMPASQLGESLAGGVGAVRS